MLQEAVLVGALLDELIGIWDEAQGAFSEEGGDAPKVTAEEDRLFAWGESELEALTELRTQFASAS